jgi:hypothetical protein
MLIGLLQNLLGPSIVVIIRFVKITREKLIEYWYQIGLSGFHA